MIKKHRVYYLYQAVKYGGIRNAADILNVAPSSISRQITLLEEELKTSLLEKNLRGAHPTESGELVLKYFAHSLEQEEDLLASLAALQGLERGKVAIATGEGYLRHLATIISQFSKDHPQIEVQLSAGSSNHVVRKVSDNEAHIGIAFNPILEPNLRVHFKRQHTVKAFLPPIHPLLNEKAPLTLAQIRDYPLAMGDISQGIRQIIQRVEDEEEITLHPTLKCSQLHMLKQYAIGGGVTLLPEFMLYEEDRDRLALHHLSHPYFNRTETYMMTRRGRQLPPAAQKLLVMILKMFP